MQFSKSSQYLKLLYMGVAKEEEGHLARRACGVGGALGRKACGVGGALGEEGMWSGRGTW